MSVSIVLFPYKEAFQYVANFLDLFTVFYRALISSPGTFDWDSAKIS